jgi:hypothetical protein
VSYKGIKYSYLSEEKITGIIRELMVKHGLIIVPETMEELEPVENITRIKVTYRIGSVDDDSSITVQTLGYGKDSGDKGIYKAMTGAFKYAQRETFMISTGDDPDKTSSEELDSPPRKSSQRSSVKPPQSSKSKAQAGTSSPKDKAKIEKIKGRINQLLKAMDNGIAWNKEQMKGHENWAVKQWIEKEKELIDLKEAQDNF